MTVTNLHNWNLFGQTQKVKTVQVRCFFGLAIHATTLSNPFSMVTLRQFRGLFSFRCRIGPTECVQWRPCWRSKTIKPICIKIKLFSQWKRILLFSPPAWPLRTHPIAADSLIFPFYLLGDEKMEKCYTAVSRTRKPSIFTPQVINLT